VDDAWFDPWCPIRNVTSAYPPTVLVHGSADADVPHDESARLAARLAEARVDHEFHSLAGVGHGFASASVEEIEAAEAAVAGFIHIHLAPDA
jgi:acetyl esterase/lipase